MICNKKEKFNKINEKQLFRNLIEKTLICFVKNKTFRFFPRKKKITSPQNFLSTDFFKLILFLFRTKFFFNFNRNHKRIFKIVKIEKLTIFHFQWSIAACMVNNTQKNAS